MSTMQSSKRVDHQPSRCVGRTDAVGYAAVLRTPGALAFVVPGIVGRMPMGMTGLAVLMLVTSVTGRYGVAGAVAAGGAVAYAVVAPRVSAQADQHGQRRVLRRQVSFHAASTLALVLCAGMHAPLWTLFLTGGLTKATMPTTGSMVRSRWSGLLRGSPLLHTALSLESVADEVVYILGPMVVTLVVLHVVPAAGVVAAAALGVIGVVLLTAQRGTEPVPQRRKPHARGAIRVPGMGTFIAIHACLGAMFIGIDLAALAFARMHHATVVVGPLLASYGVGSALAGVWFGARRRRMRLDTCFLVCLATMVGGVGPLVLAPDTGWLMLGLLLAGTGIAPTLVCGYAIVELVLPQGLMAEGMTWLSSAAGLGAALGAPSIGWLIDRQGSGAGFAATFAFGVGALAVGLCRRRQLAALVQSGATDPLRDRSDRVAHPPTGRQVEPVRDEDGVAGGQEGRRAEAGPRR